MGRYVDEASPFEREPLPRNDFRPDEAHGLYRKFNVSRVSDPKGKHKNCEYFVLDMSHDKFARDALNAYASACEHEYPQLAADLRERYSL